MITLPGRKGHLAEHTVESRVSGFAFRGCWNTS